MEKIVFDNVVLLLVIEGYFYKEISKCVDVVFEMVGFCSKVCNLFIILFGGE